MLMSLLRFVRCENGAVTVDWVVMSAAVIGVGMFVLIPIAFSSESSAVAIGDAIGASEIGYVSDR